MNTALRLLAMLLPVAVLLVLYRPAFDAWFLFDDFAWLNLPKDVAARGWLDALAGARAQGTVRLLSERLYFLALGGAPLDPLPFRIVTLATHAAGIVLLGLLAIRLSGLWLAGPLAGLLWAVNARVALPMLWASVYNQVLISFLMIAAAYCLVRYAESGQQRWWILLWAAYLAGFGALESAVLFPLLALLYARWQAPHLTRRLLWLLAPAVMFALLHAFVIPKSASPIYRAYFDAAMLKNFLRYFGWSAGPARLGTNVAPELGRWGLAIAGLCGVTAAYFALWRWLKGDRLGFWMLAWFALFLLPVLPLKNHVSDYYVTLPSAGLAMLGGWALAAAWGTNWPGRIAASVLAAAYVWGSVTEVRSIQSVLVRRSLGLRDTVEAAAAAHAAGKRVVLAGVSDDLFDSGFQDGAFATMGIAQVWLAPGSEAGITARDDLGGLRPFQASAGEITSWLEKGEAVVLEVSGKPRNVTSQYRLIAPAIAALENPLFVDVGNPLHARHLLDGWHPIENGFRWMGRTAAFRLRAPDAPGRQLVVMGYVSPAAVAGEPLAVRFFAGDHEIGQALFRAEERFERRFPLPVSAPGSAQIEIRIEAARTFHPPGDTRELSLVFGAFAVR